jgi:uncharacterized protein YigE (DUF2233 family)
MRSFWQAGLILWLAWASLPAGLCAAKAELVPYKGVDYIVFRLDLDKEDLQLLWRDPAGKPLAAFSKVRERLASQSRDLLFAMNAGIYSREGTPLGLHVENNQTLCPLNLGETAGGQFNFYLKPNGVFFVISNRPAILETTQYAKLNLRPQWACQSGPLLLERGKIHPAFRAGSTNLHWRSGVGVTRSHQAVFAITLAPLCFFDFARFFQEKADCDYALYLDGDICAVYLPEIGFKSDAQAKFAGIFAVSSKPTAEKTKTP